MSPAQKTLLVSVYIITLNLKDIDAGKDWRQEKETLEDEIAGWHHRLNQHESEQALGESTGKPDMWLQSMESQRVGTTEQLNKNKKDTDKFKFGRNALIFCY